MSTDNDGRTLDAPAALPSSSNTPREEAEAEALALALCAWWEEQRRLREEGECPTGCERSDGPLAPCGCKW